VLDTIVFMPPLCTTMDDISGGVAAISAAIHDILPTQQSVARK
jgi:adenosylmethionine-8-amino-7-oxononanoate aminotransferase